MPDIVGREQDHREINFRMAFKLFNYSSSLIWLLMKDDGFQVQLCQEASNCLFSCLIVTVNDEYPAVAWNTTIPGLGGWLSDAQVLPLFIQTCDETFKHCYCLGYSRGKLSLEFVVLVEVVVAAVPDIVVAMVMEFRRVWTENLPYRLGYCSRRSLP